MKTFWSWIRSAPRWLWAVVVGSVLLLAVLLRPRRSTVESVAAESLRDELDDLSDVIDADVTEARAAEVEARAAPERLAAERDEAAARVEADTVAVESQRGPVAHDWRP